MPNTSGKKPKRKPAKGPKSLKAAVQEIGQRLLGIGSGARGKQIDREVDKATRGRKDMKQQKGRR